MNHTWNCDCPNCTSGHRPKLDLILRNDEVKIESKNQLNVTIDFNGDSVYMREENSDLLINVVKLTSPKQVREMKSFFEELFNRIEGRVIVLEEVDEDKSNAINEWDFS